MTRLKAPAIPLLKVGLRLIVSAGALYAVLRNVQIEHMVENFSGLSPLPVIAAVGVLLSTWPLAIWRAQLMLPEQLVDRWRVALDSYAIGALGNFLAPMRGGDLVRCYIVSSRSSNISFSAALGTVVMEKIFDLVTVVLIVGAWSLVAIVPAWVSTAILALGCVLLVGLLLFFFSDRITKLAGTYTTIGFGSALLSKLTTLSDEFRLGVKGARKRGTLAMVVIQTLILQILGGAFFYVLGASLGVEIGFLESLVVSALAGLAFAVPAAPGAIGTYEFAVVFGLNIFGFDDGSALAFAISAHSAVLVMGALIGGLAATAYPGGFKAATRGPYSNRPK